MAVKAPAHALARFLHETFLAGLVQEEARRKNSWRQLSSEARGIYLRVAGALLESPPKCLIEAIARRKETLP